MDRADQKEKQWMERRWDDVKVKAIVVNKTKNNGGKTGLKYG